MLLTMDSPEGALHLASMDPLENAGFVCYG